MKLRNKKTGDIGVLNISSNKYQVIAYGLPLCGNSVLGEYDTLDALMQEWEDYEEPKVPVPVRIISPIDEDDSEVIMEFNTHEQAVEVVEKLKAWGRLGGKGFEFAKWQTWEKVTGLDCFDRGVANSYYAGFTFGSEDRLEKDEQVKKDLDLLFGGEK